MIFLGRSFSQKSELCELKRLSLFWADLKKRNVTDPSPNAVEKVDPPGAPRFIFIRASLETAKLQDKELRRLATSPDRAENQQAIAILEPEAATAPEKELIPPRWDHPNASYWLKRTEADSQAFVYSSEELHVAAVFCAAELQVSRELKIPDL